MPSSLRPVLVLAGALLLACGGGSSSDAPPPPPPPPPAGSTDAPPPPPVAPAPGATPADAPATPAATTPPPVAPPLPVTPIVCCDNERATRVLAAYLDLQVALAKDDNAHAAGELMQLKGTALAAKDKGGMDAASNALLETIRAEADAAFKTEPIANRRTRFVSLSTAMTTFAKAHAGAGPTTVREAWCPMYPGGWLQEGSVIQNPYYGKEMLTCGSFK